MNEREAFLRAICATPEDDTARLVFADWLDEQENATDNERAIAEFIRVSCSGSGRKQMPEAARVWLKENWQRLVPFILRHHTPQLGETNKKFLTAIQVGGEISASLRFVFKRGQAKARTVETNVTFHFRRGFLVRFATKSSYVRTAVNREIRERKPLVYMPKPTRQPATP